MRSNERDNFRGKGQVRGSYRGKHKDNGRKKGGRQMNPIDRNTGEIFRSSIFKNIFHIVRDCPDLESGFPKDKFREPWFNIIHEKGNIENIDSKLLISWKRDLTESNRVFILQNQTNDKKIKERW